MPSASAGGSRRGAAGDPPPRVAAPAVAIIRLFFSLQSVQTLPPWRSTRYRDSHAHVTCSWHLHQHLAWCHIPHSTFDSQIERRTMPTSIGHGHTRSKPPRRLHGANAGAADRSVEQLADTADTGTPELPSTRSNNTSSGKALMEIAKKQKLKLRQEQRRLALEAESEGKAAPPATPHGGRACGCQPSMRGRQQPAHTRGGGNAACARGVRAHVRVRAHACAWQ